MLRIIVNGDDFGASPGVNLAIMMAFRSGVLNSASLIMNAPYAGEALRLAAEHPALKVGIHLNLTSQGQERSLASPRDIPLLTDGGGRFRYGFLDLLRLSLTNKRELQRQVEIEMRAQIDGALAAGLSPAHLDSHRHVHMIPALFEVARKLKDAYRIERLRNVNEKLGATWRGSRPGWSLLNGGLVKFIVLKICSRFNHYEGEIYFYSILHSTRLFGRSISRIMLPPPYRAVEICFHPSLIEVDRSIGDPAFADYHLYSFDRQKEFEALLEAPFLERFQFENESGL